MTQQYTPVAWQDETTSQQGTLINAERLNQMQTAHHYADGFEEVDAVPTANPSVAYHKIVYCTADSTFYRWDGTEWTKDIDDETKALLQQEIARATEAEGELAQDIADETARATARETALDGAITAEETAREQADTALGNRITAEATARESADTELGADIGAETARARQAEQTNAQAIATHVADKQNPHEVTKAQVGLGNVDNTSDLDKPISTATQTALNEKASTTAVQAVTARVDTLESAVADRYTKTETDTLLATKADSTALTAKLDTLSTTGLHAYTHNGATQSEVAVIDGTTASTIPIRDANGRLQAADPADGATDKTLTTANWVSQTGDSAPSNLLHKNGNETADGLKIFNDCPRAVLFNSPIDDNNTGAVGYFKKIAVIPRVNFGTRSHTLFAFTTRQRARGFDVLSLYTNQTNALDLTLVLRTNSENYTYILSQDDDNIYISIMCANSLADGMQGIILGQTGLNSSILNCMLLGGEITETLTGTEIRRLTP